MGEERKLQFEQRAYEHYRSEMDDLEKVQALMGEKETGDIEEYREPLSFDERREITVLLSWGWPSDGYKIYFDMDNLAIEGSYFFADWFEYEEFKLTDEELGRVIAVYPVSPE